MAFSVRQSRCVGMLWVLLVEVEKCFAFLAHPPPICWHQCVYSCLPQPGLSKMSQAFAGFFNSSVTLMDVLREWHLGRCSGRWGGSRRKGNRAESGGKEPAPPVQLGLEEYSRPCLCGSKECVFWRLRVAFVLVLRFQCWKSFRIHQWCGIGNFRYALAQGHFTCRVFLECKVDAWKFSSWNATFRNLGAMKKFGLTRWGGNSKRYTEFSPEKASF